MSNVNTWLLFGIAVAQLLTALLAWSTRSIALKTEINTNSMKDALVAATGEAAHAAGKVEGLAESAVTAATLAKGQLADRNK